MTLVACNDTLNNELVLFLSFNILLSNIILKETFDRKPLTIGGLVKPHHLHTPWLVDFGYKPKFV